MGKKERDCERGETPVRPRWVAQDPRWSVLGARSLSDLGRAHRAWPMGCLGGMDSRLSRLRQTARVLCPSLCGLLYTSLRGSRDTTRRHRQSLSHCRGGASTAAGTHRTPYRQPIGARPDARGRRHVRLYSISVRTARENLERRGWCYGVVADLHSSSTRCST